MREFETIDHSGLVVDAEGGNCERVGTPGMRNWFGRGSSNAIQGRVEGRVGGRASSTSFGMKSGGRGVTRPRQGSQEDDNSPKRRGSVISQTSGSRENQASDEGIDRAEDSETENMGVQESGDCQTGDLRQVQPTPIFGGLRDSREQQLRE